VSRLGFVLAPLRSVVGAVRTTGRTVAAIPHVVEAVLVLPTLSRQLEDVRTSTAHLPDILSQLELVHDDTTCLPAIQEELERICATVGNVERNTLAVEQLAEIAVPLQGAAVRVGRFADRLPQRRLQRPPAG
jgi:hypothetical protein